MKDLILSLQELCTAAIVRALSAELQDFPELRIAEITPSTQPQFGHYQCNSALKIGKALGQNPRAVAERIKGELAQESLFSFIEVAGPGFINLTLKESFLSHELSLQLADSRLGVPLPKSAQRIVIDFSSPNVAKEMHVGHLRSTIIGDCLARLFEFLGHDVLRLNHVGDWGTQFGMLIACIQEEAPEVLQGKEEADLPHLMQWYRFSKERFDADPAFKKKAHQKVVELQAKDPAAIAAWERICEISRRGYQEIYDILDVRLIERGESFYNPELPKVVADLTKKGLVSLSEGAKCLFLEGFTTKEGAPLPLIVQKSDGGYNYATTDMAAIRQRIEEERADRILYVIDSGQNLHLQMVFAAAEKAGYLDPAKVRVDHVGFGVVLNEEGKKFKTRSGKTEKLIDLLQEAIEHAFRVLKERGLQATDEELKSIAQVIGIDAVKYADLSSSRLKDYIFSYDRMLRFEGNTAVFLLYSYVRIQGIKRKVGKDLQTLLQNPKIELKHPSEVALGLHLRRFSEVLDSITRDLMPHRLADYLYGLAERFNAFFRDCRVEGTDEEDSRLQLCELTARVLAKGLELLGLKVVDRM